MYIVSACIFFIKIIQADTIKKIQAYDKHIVSKISLYLYNRVVSRDKDARREWIAIETRPPVHLQKGDKLARVN